MSKIFNLTEAASIALHSIVLIAQSKDGLNVIKIAELTSSSKHHVAKVLQRLVKEDFLTSNRGPHGGFALKKKPENITLLNVYEAIEGVIQINECPLNYPNCPFGECLIGNITSKMTLDFRDFMATRTIDKYL